MNDAARSGVRLKTSSVRTRTGDGDVFDPLTSHRSLDRVVIVEMLVIAKVSPESPIDRRRSHYVVAVVEG